MKIEFSNGSVIESIDTEPKNDNTRGKRAENIYFDDNRPNFKNKIILRFILFKNGLFTRFKR